MKSTEPWSDDYYTFDIEAALQAVGFAPPITVPSDPDTGQLLRGNQIRV